MKLPEKKLTYVPDGLSEKLEKQVWISEANFIFGSTILPQGSTQLLIFTKTFKLAAAR